MDSKPIKFVSMQFAIVGVAQPRIATNGPQVPIVAYVGVCEDGKLWRKMVPMGQEENEGWTQWY